MKFSFAFPQRNDAILHLSAATYRKINARLTGNFTNQGNKTHKKLTRKFLFGISLNVTKVTVFETSEGTANGVVRLWERVKAERFALAMTPLVEAERLARRAERFSRRPDKNG